MDGFVNNLPGPDSSPRSLIARTLKNYQETARLEFAKGDLLRGSNSPKSDKAYSVKATSAGDGDALETALSSREFSEKGEDDTEGPLRFSPTPSAPINIPGAGGRAGNQAPDWPLLGDEQEAQLLLSPCGLPPKKPNWGHLANSPDRARAPRRSILATLLESDHYRLREARVMYQGELFLPLNADTYSKLRIFFEDEEPRANVNVFEHILVNKDVNDIDADNFVDILERIGLHCKHLVIVNPVKTTVFEDVFKLEVDQVNTVEEWDKIIACFPNLEIIKFEHPADEPTANMKQTFLKWYAAVHAAELPNLKSVELSVPRTLNDDLFIHFFDKANAERIPMNAEASSAEEATNMAEDENDG